MVRSEEAVAPSLDEPKKSFSLANNEMVACSLILEVGMRNVTFKTDMMKFCGMISVITIDLDCWTYVKSSQRTRDGSMACRDFWDHFLGQDNFG